jgi:hypothetical protein
MLSLILACTIPLEVVEKNPGVDLDGDGYIALADGGDDCADTNADVHPGAEESCNSIDDDCNGRVDDGVFESWYPDGDGDGFGSALGVVQSCLQPADYVADSTDCDDSDAESFPGAVELCSDPVDRNCDGIFAFEDNDGDGVPACEDCDDGDSSRFPGEVERCDGIDQDCDGFVDEDAVDGQIWYPDSDNDGYGTVNGSINACAEDGGPPSGYSDNTQDCNDSDRDFNPDAIESDCDDPNDYNCDGSTGGADGDNDGFVACEDCNDGDSSINPAAEELCDGVDNNCDGNVDDSGSNSITFYADADGDGYGDPSATTLSCAIPRGYVSNFQDCDDTDPTTNPAAVETCDELDNDCDGSIDNNAIDPATFYRDSDHDGYGDLNSTTQSCEVPAGYVTDSTDCDDSDAAFNPGATEDDCSDPTDYNCDGSVGFDDNDSDGFAACEECDDTDSSINPNAQEICDELDNDCDGAIDDSDSDVDTSAGSIFYADGDGDGYGDSSSTIEACAQPAGYVDNNTDCDDGDAETNPDTSWYADTDGDNYGDPTVLVQSCLQPTGYVSDRTDCDDTTSLRNPGNTEICDSVNRDEDCDNLSDNNDPSASSATKTTFYRDSDSDGYGASSSGTTQACDVPSGYDAENTDCNDGNAAISPGDSEICDASNTDEDCDGLADNNDPSALASGKTVYYLDSDSDGYGSTTPGSYCDLPSGYASNNTDCNDNNAGISPGDTEICDASNTDEDCDGLADNNDPSALAATKTTYYLDADFDGYGAAASPAAYCDLPAGYAANSTDCNDGNAGISPGDAEICDSSNVDEDCDGLADNNDPSALAATKTTYYLDSDSDGYGNPSISAAYCDLPSGYAANNTDCNDSNAGISPGDSEICDASNVDEDCDGLADNNDPSALAATKTTYYLDSDGDGYGSTTSAAYCDLPSGYAANNTDCNDSNAAISPGDDEICDASNVDEDCDGLADNNDPSALASGKTTYYLDSDGDGYGSTTSAAYCDLPSGYAANNTDCNDSNAAISPGDSEICDASNVDEDCDGLADNADSSALAAGKTTYYLDSDGDSYGSTTGASYCDIPTGYSANDDDCDDGDDQVNPGEDEYCDIDGADNDCNALSLDSGIVSLLSGSTYSDITTAFTTQPYTLPSSGSIYICDGSYTVELVSTGASTVTLVGLDGALTTILTGNDIDPVLSISATSTAIAQTITLQDITISGSQRATSGSGGSVFGGAIYLYNAGGIPTDPQLTLDGCTLTDNDADQGGAIAIGSTVTGQGGGYLLLEESVIDSNGTGETNDGGGIYIQSGLLECINSDFTANNAKHGTGGAIYIAATDAITHVDSTNCYWGVTADNNFSGSNTASDIDGAGFAVYNISGTQTVPFICTGAGCVP